MSEPISPAACQLCGGPVSKKNTSGFCNRNPGCKRKGQLIANARYRAAHPELAAEKWAVYGPGYKERRAELDANRRKDPEFRDRARKAVQEYKSRPENADRVREYNRRGRLRYLARIDRLCLYPTGCDQYAPTGLIYCRPHHNTISLHRYHRTAAHFKLYLAGTQEWTCPWCCKLLPPSLAHTHVDHIIPRASGLVIEEEWNLQLLHGRCNQQKSDKITPQAITLAAEHGLPLLHQYKISC